MRGSTSSTIEPRGGRSYFGGSSDASASLTVFFEMPITRAIIFFGNFSARYSRRISAQSSTLNTHFPLTSAEVSITEGVSFQLPLGGQFSRAVDSDELSRLVLVDSFGLSWNRTSPRFALPLLAYIARPTEQTRDRFLAQCFLDFDGVRGQLGERIGLSERQIRRDLERGTEHDFEESELYRKVFELADARAPAPRALVPSIRLKSVKFTRELTTEWFARRVDGRYRRCLQASP